ncbi:hypothetical protein ACROYT_G000270 [Oculina patagonica]
MALSKQVLAKELSGNIFLDGCVNGHNFTIEGEATGQPYEGHQSIKLRVTSGAPLPFAFDIISATFCYGNRPMTKYPEEIPDFFKQALASPGGLSWERSITCEDGGSAAVSCHISLNGNRFVHKSKFVGVNFPPNGPVMQKKTLGWERSIEKMTVRDGALEGNLTMFLMLEGGGNYRCEYRSIYKAKENVQMPKSHFIEHLLVRNNIEKDAKGNTIELIEDAVARN